MRVPVEICRVLINEGVDEQWVFLRESEGSSAGTKPLRGLSMAIGIFEALALDLAIKGRRAPRPLTHQLTLSLLEAAGGRVDGVLIRGVEGGVYQATIEVLTPSGRVEVDARPSDGLTLAQLAKAPLWAEESILGDPEWIPLSQP